MFETVPVALPVALPVMLPVIYRKSYINAIDFLGQKSTGKEAFQAGFYEIVTPH